MKSTTPNHTKPKKRPAGKKPRTGRKHTSSRLQAIACVAAGLLLVCLIVVPRLLGSPQEAAQPDAVQTLTDVNSGPIEDEPSAESTLGDDDFDELGDGELTDGEDPDLAATEDSSLFEVEGTNSIKSKKIGLRQAAIKAGKRVKSYEREQPIAMGAPDTYAQLPGVTTFRGNNWRDNSAYGQVPDGASKLEVVWSTGVGGIDDWNGVGWTGQAAIVQWPADVRSTMNIRSSKIDKDGLKEVIIAALDGKIRFLDLDDGEMTRKSINIGAPIKGSVTIDPRGYPVLYCGQGLFEVGGRFVKSGTRAISLIDYKLLFFLNGQDKFRTRNWYTFDAAPLVDGATDTMFQVGENGLIYSVQMNTEYDRAGGKIKMKPVVDRWGYKSAVTTRPGIENSIAVYNHYGYFVDNSGLMICLDLNTLTPKWAAAMGDDTDATTAIEQADDGVWLYTANEMDLRGNAGNIQMRCIDALTGQQRWKGDVSVSNRELAGSFASPAIGKNGLSELVYFHISKTNKGGTLYALDKVTGDVVWSEGLGAYGWSTPALMYDSTGRGYILIGSSSGKLRLIDGLTGKLINSIDLKSNIEGSPAVYDDMAVVSTRGGKIYGIRIS